MLKKPVFFLFFILLLLPISGSGFDMPCLSWSSTSSTTALAARAPFSGLEPPLQVEVVLPVSKDEFLEVYSHQLGLLLITLLPLLDYHLGTGSRELARLFSLYLYTGLYLESIFQLASYIPRMAFDFMLQNMGQEFYFSGQGGSRQVYGLNTDIPSYSHSLSRPLRTSLYIKTESDNGIFFSEADQMVDYARLLFKQAQDNQRAAYSPDNQAFATPPLQSGEYEVYQLSVTNPDNATHIYDIAHKKGCNWLLTRDGVPVGNELVASWPEGTNTAMSFSPASSPPPLIRNKLTLHIPRTFLGLLMSRATSLLIPLQQDLMSELGGMVSKLIISTELVSEANRFDLVPVKAPDTVMPNPLLPQSVDFLPAWPLLAAQGSISIPGIIQLMERQQGDSIRPGSSFSSGAGEGGQQASKRPPDKGIDPSKDDSGDGDERGASPDSSTSSLSSSGNGMSLIELVSRERIIRFSGQTTSHYLRRVNIGYIKLLSRAGLAQVIVREGSDYASWPLGISKTLLGYLTSYKGKDGLPDRRASLMAKQEGKSYYVEMDQEIYDVMLERFDEIKLLAEKRSEIFTAYRKDLSALIYGLNQFQPGHRYVFIGGEALSAQMAMLQDKSHFLRGNFPIRDDVDVLMRLGDIDMFRRSFLSVNSYLVIPPRVLSMSFSFPSQNGMNWFSVYKFQLKSVWGDFLPTLDISFPEDEGAPNFGDNQRVLVDSLNRALKYKEDKQKYLDRTLFLHKLLPESLGAEYLYHREFTLPSLVADRERLLKMLGQSEPEQQQQKGLEARIQKQQEELDTSLNEMETLKQASKEQLEQLRLELDMEMNTRLEARMGDLIEKSRKQTENYSAELARFQAQEDDLSRQLKTKGKVVSALMLDLEQHTSELNRVQGELRDALQRQTGLEALLQKIEPEAKVDTVAREHVEEAKILKSQNDELQREVKELKEANDKEKARVTQLKAVVQKARHKYDENKVEIARLSQEKERHNQEYALLKTQFEESQVRLTLLESELAELQNQNQLLRTREATYEQSKRDINIEFEQMENRLREAERENERLAQVERENEQLREAVRRHRNDRNWRVAAGMVPAVVLVMREFLVPRFYDVAKATCSRFKRDIIREYCIRNWISEDKVLWALEAYEDMPGHTRIVRFTEPEHFEPGYYLAGQVITNHVELINSLLQTKDMNLHLPEGFTPLENLYPSELGQSLAAFFPALAHRELPTDVKRFAKANLLLCGIMPNVKQQHDCAGALSTAMGEAERWPCHMHHLANPEDNICERMMLSGFTRKLTREKLLALLPSWYVKPDGGMQWYDTWPVLINKHRLSKELPGGSCSRFVELTKYCADEAMRIWKFTNNHWNLASHLCKDISVDAIGMPRAFWLQSWTGDINDILACDGTTFLRTVWQP